APEYLTHIPIGLAVAGNNELGHSTILPSEGE
ncbi:unnamed protein product, partial [marine sediment metagenome]